MKATLCIVEIDFTRGVIELVAPNEEIEATVAIDVRQGGCEIPAAMLQTEGDGLCCGLKATFTVTEPNMKGGLIKVVGDDDVRISVAVEISRISPMKEAHVFRGVLNLIGAARLAQYQLVAFPRKGRLIPAVTKNEYIHSTITIEVVDHRFSGVNTTFACAIQKLGIERLTLTCPRIEFEIAIARSLGSLIVFVLLFGHEIIGATVAISIKKNARSIPPASNEISRALSIFGNCCRCHHIGVR